MASVVAQKMDQYGKAGLTLNKEATHEVTKLAEVLKVFLRKMVEKWAAQAAGSPMLLSYYSEWSRTTTQHRIIVDVGGSKVRRHGWGNY